MLLEAGNTNQIALLTITKFCDICLWKQKSLPWHFVKMSYDKVVNKSLFFTRTKDRRQKGPCSWNWCACSAAWKIPLNQSISRATYLGLSFFLPFIVISLFSCIPLLQFSNKCRPFLFCKGQTSHFSHPRVEIDQNFQNMRLWIVIPRVTMLHFNLSMWANLHCWVDWCSMIAIAESFRPDFRPVAKMSFVHLENKNYMKSS